MDRFIRRAHPNSLSVRDLLEARDRHHVHFANLPTVIGTAVGRYRIRLADPNFKNETAVRTGEDLGPRTLRNSDFRSWSWPCVLVFVDEWLDSVTLARHPDLAAPPVLYLPDGRFVYTCPVLVEKRSPDLPPADASVYAADRFGPNFQVFVADQGDTRMGVASAIVEDGACAFSLVSRHLVAGTDPGTVVYALPRARRVDIGHVTARLVDAVPLESIYPGFAGQRSMLTLDAAVVKLSNTSTTTAQYLGVGTMGDPIDLSSDKMSPNLVGCPVFTELPGGVRVEGKVDGLFYRHATLGGVDSLTEFLIGPREVDQSVETRPGDSGAVWFWDEAADRQEVPGDAADGKVTSFRPLAVQWGGHGFKTVKSSQTTEFVLATGLSSICKALGVDVVEDWNTGQSRYWGKTGHYTIGYAACFALQTPKAVEVFKANATSIGVGSDDIAAGKLPSATQKSKFIALADVPDLVWRSSRGKDKANHFADMDEKGKGKFAGKTLMDLWFSDKSSRTPQAWTEFYSSIDPKRAPAHRGALPFRVAELYATMVKSVRSQDLDSYVCAAGVLAHFIGDSCQPLHISYLHHGQPDDTSDDDVHSVYEDDMLDQAAPQVVAGVKARIDALDYGAVFTGPMEAADAVVRLMKRTTERLPPERVLEVYDRVRGSRQSSQMWDALGNLTMDCMADGAVTLAAVWQSAWTEGGGDANRHFTMERCKTPIPTRSLKALYDNKDFAASNWLSDMTVPTAADE